jgi:hemerythrin-like domain-containing protein
MLPVSVGPMFSMEPTMKPGEEFQYEHEVIRGKLALLEEQLPWVDDVCFSVAHLIDSLAAFLRCHTAKEERFFAGLHLPYGSPQAEFVCRLQGEHENHRTRLAILHELLTQSGPAPMEQIAVQADYLIRDLREHMAFEEACLFPEIDRAALGRDEAVAAIDGAGYLPGVS